VLQPDEALDQTVMKPAAPLGLQTEDAPAHLPPELAPVETTTGSLAIVPASVEARPPGTKP
jgi:hypothetical protein